MAEPVRGLASLATKDLLADLASELRRRWSLAVRFTSAAGIEVARDVREGVHADVVVLGSAAMSELDAEGLLVSDTLRPLFVSDVVAAVADDAVPPALATEGDLRTALTSAGRIAYSTGPSGAAVVALVERWGLTRQLRDRLVQAPAGTPVGTLLTGGAADLGFQQRSELAGVPGVRVLGPLPGAAAVRSTFSGAVVAGSGNVDAARAVLERLAAPEVAELVRAGGMTPA